MNTGKLVVAQIMAHSTHLVARQGYLGYREAHARRQSVPCSRSKTPSREIACGPKTSIRADSIHAHGAVTLFLAASGYGDRPVPVHR